MPIGGGALVAHDDLDSTLGHNRNGVWIEAQSDALYVVSDAVGNGAPALIDLRGPPGPTAPAQHWEGRIVRIEYPADGTPIEPSSEGLLFAGNLYPDGEGTIAQPDLQRETVRFTAVDTDVRRARVALTLSITAGDVNATSVGRLVDTVTTWVHAQYGTNATLHVERHPASAGARAATLRASIGIARDAAANIVCALKIVRVQE